MEKQKIKHLVLWKKFQTEKIKSKKDKIRSQIVEIYYPLVQKISYKVAKNLQWKVLPEELSSFGLDGLYIAIEKYSIDRGVDFPAYANRRIGGSMIDGIRREDLIPRSVRMNSTLIDKTRQEIESKECRKVTEFEIIEELGIDQKEYLKNTKKYSPLNFVSLEGSDISNSDKQVDFNQDFLTDLADKRTSSPDSKIVRKEFLNKLISKNFSPFEQKIIYYYYYKDFTMSEIGEKLGTSESRISQIHSDLLDRMKEKIERNPDFFGKDVNEYIRECNDEDLLY